MDLMQSHKQEQLLLYIYRNGNNSFARSLSNAIHCPSNTLVCQYYVRTTYVRQYAQ